jgi:hypothetical protein
MVSVAGMASDGRSSRKLTIPKVSTLSEVNIENNDEGSSNEGSGDESSEDEDIQEDDVPEKQSTIYKLPPTFTGAPSLADVDLDAIIRGPVSQSRKVLDDIPSSDEVEDSENGVLEEDEDGDDLQYRRRLRKFQQDTSDEGEGPDFPSNGDSKEASNDEGMEYLPTKLVAQVTQPVETMSITPEAGSQSPFCCSTDILMTSIRRWLMV